MATVALVGGDGSGKTTLAKYFVETQILPSKYIYMGLSTLKSKPAFPTTLLFRYFKTRSYQKTFGSIDGQGGQTMFMQDYHHNQTRRSDLWLALRSFNYLIDVFYRLIYSWIYQIRGYLVIYDRYFLFMAAPEFRGKQQVKQHWVDHTLYWIFDRCYPKPDLVVFLDAPPEILHTRKPESDLVYLEKRRTATIEQGQKMENFVSIDATQSLEEVKTEVENIILDAYSQ